VVFLFILFIGMGGFSDEHVVWLTWKTFPVNTSHVDFGTTNNLRTTICSYPIDIIRYVFL
jgi:hypothetical protein